MDWTISIEKKVPTKVPEENFTEREKDKYANWATKQKEVISSEKQHVVCWKEKCRGKNRSCKLPGGEIENTWWEFECQILLSFECEKGILKWI